MAAKKKAKRKNSTAAFETALKKRATSKYVLRLYVAGATERSRQAIERAQKLCESHFSGHFDLNVIDVYQQPILARNGQIVATPTLVREFPRPMRRLIGNLSDLHGLFVGLDLAQQDKATI